LLTPTGRKLQDGTRAVARQIRTDILPSLTNPPAASSKNADSGLFAPPAVPLPRPPNPEDVTRIGNRLFNTISNQIQRNFETLQSDLMNPSRIPERIAKQAEEIMQEASNVFSETPVGLQEPPYTVVLSAGTEYEIRDYPEYTVATTAMTSGTTNESDDSSPPLILSSFTDQGVAFNTLASYIFGANTENRVLDMTTPVTTTMSGEMRFYIPDIVVPPEPLSQDATTTTTALYDTNPTSKIRLERLPAARLAVRRFTGFCTPGEILRQKEALLSALALDPNVEVDVPHGQTVGHIVFQYNPPYTLPVIRRNEIAVPVTILSMDGEYYDGIE
jgi:SOUL heme-binding protein